MFPEHFARVATILPWIQYVSFLLSGARVVEISSLSCQSQLVDVKAQTYSSLVRGRGWERLFPPMARAWDAVGSLKAQFRGRNFRGDGKVLAGVHDSNANYLRYLAAGLGSFTLLSTGTWIIGFDTDAQHRRARSRIVTRSAIPMSWDARSRAAGFSAARSSKSCRVAHPQRLRPSFRSRA